MKILGISGVSGAGKSTLASALAKELNMTLISWDEFDDVSIHPADYIAWYKRGQDYNEWRYPVLSTVLQSLKQGRSIVHPVHHYTIRPTKYIIFDAPLGRIHPQTGQYIDISIHIDVPLDISLSRRLLRDFKDKTKTKEDLIDEIEFYLYEARPLFADSKVKANADLIIDGSLPMTSQLITVLNYLKRL